MCKNVTIAALLAVLVALVWTDITVRRGEDGWCAWWRSNVKVCSRAIDVDHTTPREIEYVDNTNVRPTRGR